MKIISFRSQLTGYYPTSDDFSSAENRMEGGDVDRIGEPLQTLQGYLQTFDLYVSVAADKKAFPYGTRLCIPAFDEKYGEHIDFRVVDTGGAFKGTGLTRLDICCASKSDSEDIFLNDPRGHLVVAFIL